MPAWFIASVLFIAGGVLYVRWMVEQERIETEQDEAVDLVRNILTGVE